MVVPPLFGLCIILHIGKELAAPLTVQGSPNIPAPASFYGFNLAILLLQIGTILIAARVVGWIFRHLHQPQVVGEIAAGIMLGPSLLGWAAPGLSAVVFPVASLSFLNALSQIGLVVFMFLIGLELDPKTMRGRGQTAVVTSHVSIVVPFLLGSALALYLYPRLSNAGVPFISFALFMGVSMSITAFPVLARILTEYKMLGTPVGALAIACAAVDDVTAWCILAGVVLIIRAATATAHFGATLLGTAAFVCAMILGARPWLRKLSTIYHRGGKVTQDLLGGILLLALASALITEWLGIHALFGAFLLGAVMPKEKAFVEALNGKLEHLTVVLLLPLFFAFTGLRTNIGTLHSLEMWGYLGLVLLVAIFGKLGGSMVASRLTGLSWREAGTLGVLMNTRGLVELVALNIGLDIGVISPTLFTLMVLMALITTFMTSPALHWVYPARLRQNDERLAALQARVESAP
jgi:Kef-type K+ transport system membrane component KefB